MNPNYSSDRTERKEQEKRRYDKKQKVWLFLWEFGEGNWRNSEVRSWDSANQEFTEAEGLGQTWVNSQTCDEG